jgi:DNA-binding CsgD family transcriptional regulator
VGPVFLATADPLTGSFTGTFTFDIPDEAATVFFALETAGRDVVSFAALSHSAVPFGSLFAATHNRPEASDRWREVIRPLSWGDELRAAVKLRGSTWGYLCAHREAGERPFGARDYERVGALLPIIAMAIRRTAVSGTNDVELKTGVLLIDDECRIIGTTGGAAAWLDEIGDRPLGGLPLLLRGLTRLVFDTSQPVTRTVVTRTGRTGVVEAAPLQRDDEAQVAVVISPASTRHQFERLSVARGLTAREHEIVSYVLAGKPTRAIADQLTISPYTVQAHLTSVFSKIGVRSRRELISRLSD